MEDKDFYGILKGYGSDFQISKSKDNNKWYSLIVKLLTQVIDDIICYRVNKPNVLRVRSGLENQNNSKSSNWVSKSVLS